LLDFMRHEYSAAYNIKGQFRFLMLDIAATKATRVFVLALLWSFPILSGLTALQLGKSAGFDFLFYHYYNGYAALSHRMNFDVLPAGRQTFFNPAADIFLYWLIQNLPARLVGFTLGAIHGLNFVLAAAIASRVLSPPRDLLSQLLPVLLAGAGFLGAFNFGLIGSFHHDNLVSIFFLSALLILCGPMQRPHAGVRQTRAWLIAAGGLAGAGLGLKFTLAPFVVGIVCAPLCFFWPLSRRVTGAILCCAGVLAGLLITGGPHMIRMYQLFGNPVFPFFAQFSAPPYDHFLDARDLRYQPRGLWEYLFYPFITALKPLRASEIMFRDFRLATTYAAALAFLCVLGWRWVEKRRAGIAHPIWRFGPAATVFLGVIAVSYAMWLSLESLYRYAISLELLSFIILALLLFDMLDRKLALVMLVILAALLIPSTQRFGISRLKWRNEPFVMTQLPSNPKVEEKALVLMIGANGGTYYIPAFPASVRFLAADVVDTWPAHAGEFRGPPAPEAILQPFPRRMHRIADDHRGQVLTVYLANDLKRVEPVLRLYHFRRGPCGVIRSNIAAVPPLMLCELARD
jgi:hypothetical protein